MKIIAKAVMSLVAMSLSAATITVLASEPGIKIEHLGTNNTIVRVDSDSKYLLLPVQESIDDATVKIIVDGKLERTLAVRMAKSKVDYTVPLDLTPYKGHDLILDVVTSQSRSSVREAKDDACWNNLAFADTIDTTNREKYRPIYHHTPLYGWMNDPNGMVYKDGVWHLCYQWNPYGSKWQNLSWGQSTSRDLIHWDHQLNPVVEPDGLGMIFSGSSAIDTANSAGFGKDAIVSMYTSAGTSQIQSLAWSDDNGTTYHKYPGNPVITLESEARDPNMFWNDETKLWTLVLAHALDHEMLIFTSPDMKEWTLKSAFGKGLGSQDGVWECPDLFKLPVEGSDESKWVLLCNINPGGPFGGSATQYFIGDFDGTTFTPDRDASGNVPTKWMDYGKDHYATVSFSNAPDNRRTVIGWMSNWQYAAEVPTMQFRSANTLPREVGLFKGNNGQIYASSAPSPELLSLRGKAVTDVKSIKAGAKARNYNLPSINDGACEIVMDIEPGRTSDVTLTLSNHKGEKVVMTYNPAEETMSFDRRESGVTDFSQDFPAVTVSPTFGKDSRLSLRIFIDRSSIEVFGNDGRFVMTNLVFPTTPYTTLSLSAANGKAKINNLKIYTIK